MSDFDNPESIVGDNADDMAIEADTNDANDDMATKAPDDAKKLTNELKKYIVLHTPHHRQQSLES